MCLLQHCPIILYFITMQIRAAVAPKERRCVDAWEAAAACSERAHLEPARINGDAGPDYRSTAPNDAIRRRHVVRLVSGIDDSSFFGFLGGFNSDNGGVQKGSPSTPISVLLASFMLTCALSDDAS